VPPEAGRLTGKINQPEASSPVKKTGPSCPKLSVTIPYEWFTQSHAIEAMDGSARAAKAKLFRFDSPMRRASLAVGDFATELLQYGVMGNHDPILSEFSGRKICFMQSPSRRVTLT
jgi:hypothetical protein